MHPMTNTPPLPRTDPRTDPRPEFSGGSGAAPNGDYVYVRFPDGYRAVPRSQVEANTVSDKPRTAQQSRQPTPEPEPTAEFYVHLADGSVERVAESDLPGGSGTNALHGHWERDEKVYLIIGVYPVEDSVKKGEGR